MHTPTHPGMGTYETNYYLSDTLLLLSLFVGCEVKES